MAFGKSHPEWAEFEARMKARLETLQRELESPLLSLEETNFKRGQINEIRALLEDQKPAPGAPTPRY